MARLGLQLQGPLQALLCFVKTPLVNELNPVVVEFIGGFQSYITASRPAPADPRVDPGSVTKTRIRPSRRLFKPRQRPPELAGVKLLDGLGVLSRLPFLGLSQQPGALDPFLLLHGEPGGFDTTRTRRLYRSAGLDRLASDFLDNFFRSFLDALFSIRTASASRWGFFLRRRFFRHDGGRPCFRPRRFGRGLGPGLHGHGGCTFLHLLWFQLTAGPLRDRALAPGTLGSGRRHGLLPLGWYLFYTPSHLVILRKDLSGAVLGSFPDSRRAVVLWSSSSVAVRYSRFRGNQATIAPQSWRFRRRPAPLARWRRQQGLFQSQL